MDRFAMFVDAGYLFAAGGRLCCGKKKRNEFVLDAPGFVSSITAEMGEQCGLTLLRTYWYDGAKQRIPSPSQQEIAGVPGVKLRLGSMNGRNQQKGVDALIYRDLMTLARQRAIAHAFLLSGDEDLREGVQAAQEMGVRVTLIGIPPVEQAFNQSRDLVDEADDLFILTKDTLTKHITLRSIPSRPTGPARAIVPTTPTAKRPPDAERRSIESGRKFGERWWSKANDSQRAALLEDRPRIPGPLDAELLRAVEADLQFVIRHVDEVRKAARRGFWQAMTSEAREAKPQV